MGKTTALIESGNGRLVIVFTLVAMTAQTFNAGLK